MNERERNRRGDQYLIVSYVLGKIDRKAGDYARDMAQSYFNNDVRGIYESERKLNNRVREIAVVWNNYKKEHEDVDC